MVEPPTEIRIYFEGGGDSKHTKGPLRKGFAEFLKEVRARGEARRIRVRPIPCGSRGDTYEDFLLAIEQHTDAFNVLLVDAERPVERPVKEHLRHPDDNWDLSAAHETQIHLMTQAMEAWFIADPDALRDYYGPRYNPNPVPKQQNVEQVAKGDLNKALTQATKRTQKGEYHRIKHASDLLQRIAPQTVRGRAPHCERLFTVLGEVLDRA